MALPNSTQEAAQTLSRCCVGTVCPFSDLQTVPGTEGLLLLPYSKGWSPPLEPHFSPIRSSSNHFGLLRDISEHIQSLLWQVDYSWLPVTHPATLSHLFSRTEENTGGKLWWAEIRTGDTHWHLALRMGGDILYSSCLRQFKSTSRPPQIVWPRTDAKISYIWEEEGSSSRPESECGSTARRAVTNQLGCINHGGSNGKSRYDIPLIKN